MSNDRRYGYRVPLEMFLNEYVHDRAYRAMAVNVSETGLYVHRTIAPVLRTSSAVGLAFELPGTGETIWARGEVCHDSLDDQFHCEGVRFAAMADAHAKLLREYCIEKRRTQLGDLLTRVRRGRLH